MIHLFDGHSGHHVRPKPSRRPVRQARREAPVSPATSPATSPAGETGGHDLLSDAELAALNLPRRVPGATLRTTLLADPEEGTR